MAFHKAFSDMQEQARAHGERNDCAVKAVSLATGCSYSEARERLAAKGRKTGKGTYFATQTKPVVQELGFELQTVYPASKTVRTLTRELRSGTYLVQVRGHILCIKDGECLDWSAGRQHRIRAVHRIVRKGEPKPAPAAPKTISLVVKPKGVTGHVRATVQRLWAAAGYPADTTAVRKEARRVLLAEGVNGSTISVQISAWKKSKRDIVIK